MVEHIWKVEVSVKEDTEFKLVFSELAIIFTVLVLILQRRFKLSVQIQRYHCSFTDWQPGRVRLRAEMCVESKMFVC